MFPFLRDAERRPDRGDWSWGVLVVAPDTKRYFFPGGDVDTAMILARDALPPVVLDHTATRIEFGERSGNVWVAAKIVKAPPGDPDGTNPEHRVGIVHLRD